ncbi:hypothetical protein FACS1894219_00630 [Clostridia bacterium]|nr:hypothetical protein FACS1894219_00630 [Clostridia bacterium]
MDGNSKKPQTNASQSKYSFNIIDIILIIAIIAAAAVLLYIVAGKGLFSNDDEIEIQYTIEIQLIKNEFRQSINKLTPGTKIIDSVRSNDIGEIVSVSIDDAVVNAVDRNTGVVKRTPYPDHSKVRIVVKTKCKWDGVNFSANGKLIMAGVRIDFRTPYFISSGFCVTVEELTHDTSDTTPSATLDETTDADINKQTDVVE